ncbi:hypothetical protein GCM10010385_68100 [Streptomyces geysiriensis]|nr:hypothetical protein GCM10010385_68100 [Streptomyces geysiriensis]
MRALTATGLPPAEAACLARGEEPPAAPVSRPGAGPGQDPTRRRNPGGEGSPVLAQNPARYGASRPRPRRRSRDALRPGSGIGSVSAGRGYWTRLGGGVDPSAFGGRGNGIDRGDV